MRRFSVVAAIGLAVGALGPQSLRAQDTTARGTVAGVVRDSSGGRIGGAEISIVGTGLRAHTNAQGQFRLTNVPAGTVTVGVRRLGLRGDLTLYPGKKSSQRLTEGGYARVRSQRDECGYQCVLDEILTAVCLYKTANVYPQRRISLNR